MRFTAQITIDVDAESFASAADHEREIHRLFESFRSTYGACRLEIKQRRAQVASATPAQRPGRVRSTGNLAVYGS